MVTKTVIAGVVQTLAALVALILCTSTAFAQPLVQTTATQAQACGHWDEPITIEISAGRRVSIGRVAELIAEDVSNAQFEAALPVAVDDLRFRRINTRSPRSMHATSLSALVAGIYTGGDANVRTALVARLREIVQRAGMNYTSIEEKRLCCLSRSSTGDRICQSPVGMACDDGSAPRTVSRNRYVRAGFHGNFFTESFVAGDSFDRSDWRGTRGYDFRVFIKPGRRPFVMNIERVYDAAHHPRPAAALCRELTALAEAPPPTDDAASKELVFQRMAELTAATIAERDLTAAIWATRVVRDVSVRIADLEALSRAEQVIANREHRLTARWEEVQRVRTVRDRADVLKARWQKIATASLVLSLLAIIASIFIGVRTHRKTVKREIAKLVGGLEDELFQWRLFVETIVPKDDPVLQEIQEISPSNIGAHFLDAASCASFFKTARLAVKAALDRAEAELKGFDRLLLDMVAQDDIAKILRLTTARSESSGPLMLKGPVLTPRQARRVLESLVTALRTCSATRANLRRTLEVMGLQLKDLSDGAHEALSAKSFDHAKSILTDAIVKALQDEELATRRLLRDNTPPPGAAPTE